MPESPRGPEQAARRVVGGLAAGFSSIVVASILTAAAFAGLHALDLVGNLPLGVLLALLAIGAVAGEVAGKHARRDATNRALWVIVGVHVLSTSVVIYAIGWGATLAIGFPFVIARDIEDMGSRAWLPGLVWSGVGIIGGQLAIAAGIAPSYVATPYVHGLAVLTGLGVAFVVHLLGTKTADQERIEAELRAGEATFRQLFADNPQPMWVYDSETLAFLEVNQAAVRHYGYTRDEFLARRITDIRPSEDVPRLIAHLHDSDDSSHVDHGSWRHRLKDGRVIDVEVRSQAFTFEGHQAFLVAVQDMTRRNALEAELKHQAFHDSLTNLANRALFVDRIDHAITRRRRDATTVGVLVLDLDGFKTVNDSLGHTAGDALLVAVAERLLSVLRPSDTAARFGGDEFAVLLEDLEGPEDAADVARRIIDSLAKPFRLSGKEIFAYASVGIAVADRRDEGADELVRNADAAMYTAKSQGKGCFRLFEPAMHSAAMARLELEGDLRRAIEAREFILHYQPVLSLTTGQVVALEALIRWQHPERGVVAPDDFIPFAEENGLIVDIGRWVLREACCQARRWQLAHPELQLSIAVNLSARQLSDPHLVDDVAAVLAETRLDPASLTLEITESVLIDDTETAVARLSDLKATGVRLAIDDFGIGYSSLGSLRSLPIDTLKIDKAFVDGVTTGVEAAGLVQAILRLARTLHLVTIAEGVEHPEQLQRLHELGCTQIQGFCFSRPMPPESVEAFLEAHAAGAVDTAAGTAAVVA